MARYAISMIWLALAGREVMAQPARAEAETLFREAKELMAAGKIAEACAAFDASERADDSVSTLLNQGACREKNLQLATAWDHFLEAERKTRGATDDATVKLHGVALDRAKKLEARVSHLTVSVATANQIEGLEVKLGTNPIDGSAWNRALPIDGGTYTITARAPGSVEWTTTVAIQPEGDTKAVDVPRLQVVTRPVTRPQAPAVPTQTTSTPIAPIAFGAGAVVAIGAAVGFELWGESTYNRAKAEHDPAEQDSLWSSANHKRYAAEGLGIVGVASAGVALYFLLAHGTEKSTHTAVHLAPVVTPDRAGIVIVGGFW